VSPWDKKGCRDLIQEARGLLGRTDEVENLGGTGHGDVRQHAFLLDLPGHPLGIGSVDQIWQLPFVPPQNEDDGKLEALGGVDGQHLDLLLQDVEGTVPVADEGGHVVAGQVLLHPLALVVEPAEDGKVADAKLISTREVQDALADGRYLLIAVLHLQDKGLGAHAPCQLRVHPVF
jgi:hypothetical protein